MFSASLKYSVPVDCMSIVCGAMVRVKPDPARLARLCSAWPMNCALTPFSRSMSTPSKPYACISEKALSAKFCAAVASVTEIVPFWPPTDSTTFLPALCLAAMSALNWSSV